MMMVLSNLAGRVGRMDKDNTNANVPGQSTSSSNKRSKSKSKAKKKKPKMGINRVNNFNNQKRILMSLNILTISLNFNWLVKSN
jgi:hypothetical protein